MSLKLRAACPPPGERAPEDPSTTTLRWSPRAEDLQGPAGYFLGRRLGAGGFAEVFEAELRQPPLPPKRVALKRLLPGLRGDPSRRRQLQREAQIAVRLSHDNIVKVYELLELPESEGELAIAMELVDGMQASRLLHRLAQRGLVLRLPAVAYLLHGLFSALDYLETRSPLLDPAPGHPLGSRRPLVHADISLENLMLPSTGGVKLIDFGLAGEDRSLPPLVPVGEDESLTALHQVAGKPTYAPPGGVGPGAPTVQSDLYAAGVCAWELLTGLRFPVLPPGASAREIGSLIAFAAEGLPEAGWKLLQLCLSTDQTARRCTAAQGLALLQRLRADTVSPLLMGALVHALAAPEAPVPSSPLTEAVEFADGLLRRLHGGFCAHRVVMLRPESRPGTNPLGAGSPSASAGWVVAAERGAAGPSPRGAVVEQALQRGEARDPAGGLYYRVQPPTPGAPVCIVGVEPGPGCIYEPLAQALLKNLLGPGPGAAGAPGPQAGAGFPSSRNLR